MLRADKERLYQHVEFLTSIYPYRNYKNIESLRKAARYIERELDKTEIEVSTQEWEAHGNIYENIIASYQPEKPKRFILGAHYDVYKDQPGADDNASSVAGLLEMVRLVTSKEPELDYGIDFVSFCLEEPPFFKKKEMGSYIHAKSIADKKEEVIGMIALEMIGYYKGKPNSKATSTINSKELIVSGIKKYDRFNKHISSLLKVPGKVGSRRLSFADNYRNNGPSDHRNYWPFNIPAVMIIGSGGNGNPNYHRETDTLDTLDFDLMTHAVNSIAYALVNFKQV